jgi:hypothetical protein
MTVINKTIARFSVWPAPRPEPCLFVLLADRGQVRFVAGAAPTGTSIALALPEFSDRAQKLLSHRMAGGHLQDETLSSSAKFLSGQIACDNFATDQARG